MDTQTMINGTPVENMDDFKDQVIRACDQGLMHNLLMNVFHGRFFAFTSAIETVIDEHACKCETPLCEELINAVNEYSKHEVRFNSSETVDEDEELEEFPSTTHEDVLTFVPIEDEAEMYSGDMPERDLYFGDTVSTR
jgi:hypothetical protein